MRKKVTTNTALRVIGRELQKTQVRLKQLESTNRILMGLICISFLMIGLLIFFLFNPNRTMMATQFVIADETGKFQLIMGKSGITILDPFQQPRIRLGVNMDGHPQLTMFDNKGRMRSSYAIQEAGIPKLSFYDASENRRGSLSLNREGLLEFVIYDEQGKLVESFGLFPQQQIEAPLGGHPATRESDNIRSATS